MKKLLTLLVCVFLVQLCLSGKDVKISVVPENAKIYVDGNYVGDGIVTVKVQGDFLNLKFECPGYITIHTKFYKSDKRKAISYTMRKDTYGDSSYQSDLANNFFTVAVGKSYYTVDIEGKRDVTIAWKLIHQILLNYFDEIQTSDKSSGFVQTPWVYKSFPEAEVQVRTRVTVTESSNDGDLAYRIKIQNETAGLYDSHKDEFFKPDDRLLKKFESLIEEFQTRLGEKH